MNGGGPGGPDAFIRYLETIARWLSAVSQLYDYGISVDVLTFSPAGNVRRPRVSDDSSTTALNRDELRVVGRRRPRLTPDRRPDHPARLQRVPHRRNPLRHRRRLPYQHGHRVLRIARKGGKASTEPLAPPIIRALDTTSSRATRDNPRSADQRPTGGRPALHHRLQNRPPPRQKAGIPAADHITPHCLRHTFVTEALAAGAPLQDVQDAAGHADPRTTRRYDRTRKNHDNHPTFKLVSHLRRDNGP